VKAVSKVCKFSDIACSIISRLAVEIFMPKNSIVTKFFSICRYRVSGNDASPCCTAPLLFSDICNISVGSFFAFLIRSFDLLVAFRIYSALQSDFAMW